MIYYTEVLNKKNLVIDEKGNEIVDLTTTTLKDADFSFTGSHLVSKDYKMRPDLLCFVLYESFGKFAQFMKANRISNPFALNEGDIVMTPESMSIDSHFTSVTSEEVDTKDLIRAQYIDPTKQPDVGKTARDIEKYMSREKLGLPPNILEEGEKEIIISNGRIVYGPHVGAIKGDEPAQRDEYLKKLKEASKQ